MTGELETVNRFRRDNGAKSLPPVKWRDICRVTHSGKLRLLPDSARERNDAEFGAALYCALSRQALITQQPNPSAHRHFRVSVRWFMRATWLERWASAELAREGQGPLAEQTPVKTRADQRDAIIAAVQAAADRGQAVSYEPPARFDLAWRGVATARSKRLSGHELVLPSCSERFVETVLHDALLRAFAVHQITELS